MHPGAVSVFLVALATALLWSSDLAQADRSPVRWERPFTVDKRGGGLAAISCPSSRRCMAVDVKSHVVISTGPADRASSWKRTSARVDGSTGPRGIECPSVSLCVVAGIHNLFISPNPGGGAGAWSRSPIDPLAEITSLSCPSAALCVAVDNRGNVLSSTNPALLASTWQIVHVDPAADDGEGGIHAVSCPSVSFCAAVDDQGNVLTSTNPAGGLPAWRIQPVYTGIGSAGGLLDISCPSVSLCIAAGGSYGEVATSTHPSGGRQSWRGVAVSPGISEHAEGSLEFVHCDFVSVCIAADNLEHTYVTRHPTRGSSAWHGAGFGLTDVSCPTTSLCVAVDARGSVILGRTRKG
jgi:hypothetical protein